MRKVKGAQRILVILLCVILILQEMPLEVFAAEIDSITETAEDLTGQDMANSETESLAETDTEVYEIENMPETEEQENYSEAEQVSETEKSSREDEVISSEIVETDIEIESENEEITSSESVLQDGEVLSGQCGDNLTWKIENGTLTISGTGDMWDYNYEYNDQGDLVTSAPWGHYNSELESLIIETGVTSIGKKAFFNGNFSGNLVIPDSVIDIGDSAFIYCNNFSGNLEIPNSVVNIGISAFWLCDGFTGNLTIPDSVISIGDGAFGACEGFDGRLKLSKNIKTIGSRAFEHCFGLNGDLLLPNSITSIGDSAFKYCYNLSGNLVISDSIIEIGTNVFEGCSGFNKVIISSGVTEIKTATFRLCSGFEGELIIPNTVKFIGEWAFQDCTNLTDIYISEFLNEIEGNPFQTGSFINNEYISKNLNITFHCPKNSYAYNWAVENGFKVVEWNGDSTSDTANSKCGDNLTWTLKDNKESSTLTISGTGDMYDYTLENNISTAPWIKQIKSKPVTLNIEEGVTGIGKYAFYNCENINGNLIIPKSMTTIGDDAFCNCTKMTDIYIPETLTQIGRNPFRYFNALIGTFKNMELTFHCPKNSYAYNWAVKNGFKVEEWDGITIDIKKSDITINGRGYAYARFPLKDNNGQVQKNTTISYSFGGRSYTATSGSDGYIQIRSELITDNKSIKKQIKTTEIILDPNGKKEKLNNRIVMDIKVTPFTYTQTWKLGASGSVKLGASGDVGAELGAAEAEAGLGGVDITGSHKSTVCFEQEISGDKRNIELTQNINKNVGVSSDIGLKTKAEALTKNISMKGLSRSREGIIGYGDSIGLKIDNYNPGNFNQNLNIGKFVLAMAVYQNGSEFFIRLLDTMGFDIYNTASVSAGLTGKAGIDFGTIKYGDVTVGTLSNHENSTTITYTTGRDETSKSLSKETKFVTSQKEEYIGSDILGRKALSNNTEAGHSTKITEDYNHKLKTLSIDVETMRTKGELFSNKTQTETLSVEFESDEGSKLISQVTSLQQFQHGIIPFILNAEDVFQQVEEADSCGKYNRSVTSTVGDEFKFPIGIKFGADIGFTLGLEGAYELSYVTENGDFENGYIVRTGETADVSDLTRKTSSKDISHFFTDPVDIVLKQAENFLADVWGKFEDGVENAWATVKGGIKDAFDWTIHIVSISPLQRNRSFDSHAIMAFDLATEDTVEKIAYTVGDPYIVYVTNEKNERIENFADHPLELTLKYTDDMLLAAGINKENADDIAIYVHSDGLCGYECIGGVVDKKSNAVTVEITKSGEYILATDTTAPIVTVVAVSENTNKPLIYVDFDERSGFKMFSFMLDGVEVIGTANWKDYYNYTRNRISYQVENELSNGTHNVSIYAVDSAGNAMPEPFVFEFHTGNNPDTDYGDIFPEDIPVNGVIPTGLWISETVPQNYTGKAIKPAVRVYDNKTLLIEKKDYTISYKNNIKANDAKSAKTAPTITVTGKGNYTGKETAVFEILPKDISDEDIEIDDITLSYNKKVQKPTPIITWNGKKLKAKTDFLVQYTDSTAQAYQSAGTYKISVSGTGNFSGKKELEVTITNNKLIAKMKTDKIANQPYTGKEIKPEVTIKNGKTLLKKGKDYTLEYSNNTEIGQASVTIVGTGAYSGKKKMFFNITGGSIAQAKVTGLNAKMPYTGSDITQNCKLTVVLNGSTKTLKKDTDYTISYTNNRKAGKATIIFKGINGFSGVLKQNFTIAPFDIGSQSNSNCKITMPKTAPYAKGGSAPEPILTFNGETLCEGVDYTLSYKNNKQITNKNNPQVVIKGKGNFKGTRNFDFQITTQDMSNLTLNAADKMYQNKKSAYGTKVEIVDIDGKKLSAGNDYDKNLTYTYAADTKLSGNVLRKKGTAVEKNDIIPAGTVIQVSTTGKGCYKGTISGIFRITKADISKASIKVADQIYTGNLIEPDKADVTIKLSGKKIGNDCYEIVKYDRNVSKGKASLTIKGVGDYGGVKTVPFTIKSKGFLWWWRK